MLLDLPPEVLLIIFSHTDRCSSFCLGVTCPELYIFCKYNESVRVLPMPLMVNHSSSLYSFSVPGQPLYRLLKDFMGDNGFVICHIAMKFKRRAQGGLLCLCGCGGRP